MAHLFAKGVKGLFDPIIEFYQEVYSNVPLLLQLFQLDPTKRNMHLTMNCLKPGLVSKNLEVAQWSARLFSKLAFEFGDSNLLTTSWDWFVGENGGLTTTLLGLKRHPDLNELVVSILLQFARFNFVELFSIHLKRAQPDARDQILTINSLLKPLSDSSAASDELLNSGIVDEWIEFAIESATDDYKNTVDLRIASLTLLFNLWNVFPFKFEDSEERSSAVIALFNKACRDKSNSLVVSSLSVLFEMLLQFGNQKSQFAPSIYRTLTLSVIENHANLVVREFAMRNFVNVFEQLESIPLNILVEPLVRQIQVTDNVSYFFNVFDMEFFEYISKSERLQLKNAIQVLDLFFKVYLNNSVFAHLASVPILSIVQRFSESETLHEFVIKFVKVSLAMFYASEKKKRPKDRIMPLYNNKNAMTTANLSPGEIEAELSAAQKRALIIEMIKRIVTVNQQHLNDKICPLVAHTNIQIKAFSKANSKGMVSILQLFGNPDSILEKYEKEYIEHQNALKQEEKDRERDNNNTESLLDHIDPQYANQEDILKSIEENLKKYQKLTKAEATHLALLRNPRTNPKVLKNLQDVKKNYNDREEKKKQVLTKQEEDHAKEKEALRKQLMKRSLEQGVSNLNQKDVDGALLFQFGTKEKQQKREGGATDIPVIQYIDLENEEQRDKEMINILLRKYQKVLKNIFVKYSNSGFSAQFSTKNLNSFDSIKDHSSTISVPEIYKFIKEYELTDRLSKDEHQALVRIVAQEQSRNPKPEPIESSQQQLQPLEKGQKKDPLGIQQSQLMQKSALQQSASQQNMFEKGNGLRNHGITDLKDVKAFRFNAFQDYIVQFACFIYSKPPQDLRHQPLCISVQTLFDHLREVTKRKGQSTALFDEQDTQYFGESQVIKEFNKKLEENPEYPLPQGYKKIKEKTLNFSYELKETGPIQMKESFRFAYLILNDLFKEQLNFFLIEPKSVPKETLKAVPLIGGPVDVESHYMDHFKSPSVIEKKKRPLLAVSQSQPDILGPWGKPDSTKTLPSTLNVKTKYGDKRVLEIDSLHKLDLGMKLAISAMPFKDRYTAEQVAFCLDDIIKAVENNKESVTRFRKVENQVIKERKKEEEDEEINKKKANEKQKKNHDFVQTRAKEISEKNAVKEASKKEIEQKKKAEEEQLQKKKTEAVNSFWKEKKDVSEQAKVKKAEETKKALEEKLVEDKANKERKDKEFSDFNRKQLEKQSEEFKKIHEKDLKAQEDKQKQEEHQKQMKERIHQSIVKSNQERVEVEKESHRKIAEMFKREDVAQVFKQNEFKLSQVFECLRKGTFRQISRSVISDTDIDYKTFGWFCNKFNLCPDVLVNAQQIALIFRSLTRNKPIIDHKPVGLNVEDFKEALLRVAIKGKKIFNKFAESLAKGIQLNEEQMQNIADNENKDEPNKEPDDNRSVKTEQLDKMKNIIDDYGNIDEANAKTVEALIYYLALPNDKIGINEAMKIIIETGAKPTQIRKQELKQKITQDPKEFVRLNPQKAKYMQTISKSKKNNMMNSSNLADSQINQSAVVEEEDA